MTGHGLDGQIRAIWGRVFQKLAMPGRGCGSTLIHGALISPLVPGDLVISAIFITATSGGTGRCFLVFSYFILKPPVFVLSLQRPLPRVLPAGDLGSRAIHHKDGATVPAKTACDTEEVLAYTVAVIIAAPDLYMLYQNLSNGACLSDVYSRHPRAQTFRKTFPRRQKTMSRHVPERLAAGARPAPRRAVRARSPTVWAGRGNFNQLKLRESEEI